MREDEPWVEVQLRRDLHLLPVQDEVEGGHDEEPVVGAGEGG